MSKRYLWLFLTVTTLITSGIFLTTPSAQAVNAKVFIDPAKVIGDLTPAPGSVASWKVNVSNIGTPGLIGHEFYLTLDPDAFPEHKPLTNQNFTTDASGWTPTLTAGYRGTPTYGYYATSGNPSPGSGPGSYRMRINATGTGLTGTITYYLNQSFTWNVGAPPDQGALLSFAYTISGNSFGSVGVGIRVIKPDKGIATLIPSKTITSAKPWTYNFTVAPSNAFTLPGTYVFQLRTQLTTAGTATTNYLEMKWDDVGLILAPVSATEGPFFTSDVRNVGKTFWTCKYMRYPTNVSLYVADSLTGIPWTDVYPVQGNGTIADIKLRANYGAADLNLWSTLLTQPGLVPPYPPEPITHTTIDGYFKNKLNGDANGDRTVNVLDMGTLSGRWTGAPGALPYLRDVDCNDDGVINVLDMGVVSANWGRTYP